MSAPLDLRDLERRYGHPACCRECDDVMALVAHVRALRAALTWILTDGELRRANRDCATEVLASCTDGETAP